MFLALGLALTVGVPLATAGTGDRTLYLYYTHTKETGTFTFRKNGKYDQKVLGELNHFLRDWRRNEETKMDPALFDLIWQVYRDVGATKPISVVSAYRAPATNAMLRSRSSAVAENSRHTMGMAMDFFIPGVPLSRLREAAMKQQVGGVGYYPASGSPFVHLDTGNVRAWPRMTRAQLKKLFPDGKTLHLPAESNVPLSQEGYQVARAEWNKCHSIPCSTVARGSSFAVAQADSGGASAGNGKTLMGWLFGENADSPDADKAPVPASKVVVASAPAVPPVPVLRPAALYRGIDPVPTMDTDGDITVAVAELVVPVPDAPPAWHADGFDAGIDTSFTVASISSVADDRIPSPAPAAPMPTLTAYAPATAPEPDAQRALAMMLEQRAAENTRQAPDLNTTSLKAGMAGDATDVAVLSALIAGTMQSIMPSRSTAEPAALFEMRIPVLVAPDLAHAADLFVNPAFVSSDRFAIIFAQNVGDLSPATELGSFAPRLTMDQDPAFGLGRSYFVRGASRLVATREGISG